MDPQVSEKTTTTVERATKRQRVLKQGKILFPNSMSVMDCVIRDASTAGAKLLCGDPAAVPNEFRLVFLAEGVLRDAKVAWRKPDQIGVLFTSEPRRGPARKW